jgi:hypothetical protein
VTTHSACDPRAVQVGSGPLLDKGAFGPGLWIPVSFRVTEDFKDTSNPIVDTDYRFGFITTFQCALGDEVRLGAKKTSSPGCGQTPP